MKTITEEPLISIVMPCYNSSKTIKESIESVIKQTYSNWELIIIDDFSSDGTVEIIKQYEKLGKIKGYFKKENSGVANSRNIGINISTGGYIAFLDSDDLWENDKLAKQVKYMMINKISFTHTSVKYINFSGEYLPAENIPQEKISYSSLKFNNIITTSSVMVKKKFLAGIKMEDGDFHEDFLFWLELLKKNKISAHCVTNAYVTYRFQKGSKSANKIKSFIMTYDVYRRLGINPLFSLLYTCSHLLKAGLKYKKIFMTKKNSKE